jgi:YidC/Oxa1 family membrane protein insertase
MQTNAMRQNDPAKSTGLDDARVTDALSGLAREGGSESAPRTQALAGVGRGAEAETGAGSGAESVPLWTGIIEGEFFEAELTNRGAALTRWTLHDFTELENGKPGQPIELVSVDAAHPRALTMAFEELGLGDLSGELFRVESQSRDQVVFVLERGGIEIRKRYEFDLEGYLFELFVEVRNGSNHLIAPDFALFWPAVVREGNDYAEQSLVVLHAEDLEREQVASVGGGGFLGGLFGGGDSEEVWRDVSWAGTDLKFFASVLMPEPVAGTRADFEPLTVGESAAAVLRFAPNEIARGEVGERHVTGFLGPKQPELLDALGRQLSRVVDLGYSWFEPLTLFFQWLLRLSYSIIPNYGVAIILITILVRVLTLPIMNRQMRSMEKMRALQPLLKEIQAEFSDDRQKQSERTMALYKEKGVNPLGGCLPMVLQFPVFIGLFFALKSSFALRQAPFMLWINDLSAPDMLFTIPGLDFPFRLLPVIMGGSMVLQQKLTPTTVDPSQQTMMMVMMPVMMTVLFYQFPSGLVLYWMVSNFLGIAHQMLVGRRMKAQEAAA